MNTLRKNFNTLFSFWFFLFTIICTSLLIVNFTGLEAQATDPPQPRLLELTDFLDTSRPKLVSGTVDLWARDEQWRTDSVIDYCRFYFFDSVASEWEFIKTDANPSVPTESTTDDTSQRNWWGVEWDTTSAPNGPCEVRVNMFIDGNYATDTMTVFVDHTPPFPEIIGVSEYEAVTGEIELGCEFDAQDIVSIKWEYQPIDFFYEQGIPKMDQFDDDRPNDGEAYAAPTAHAAALKWWAQEYPNTFGGLIKKSNNTTMSEDELIAGLAEVMGTDPDTGTSVQGQIDGLREWIKTHGGGLSVSGPIPVTPEIYRNELENKGTVTIGIYWQDTGHRVTGNAVANYLNIDGTIWIEFMDPYLDEITTAKMDSDGNLTFEGDDGVYTADNMITMSRAESLTSWTLIEESTITQWENDDEKVEWDTDNLDPGMYFLKVTIEDSDGNIGIHKVAVLVAGGDYDEDGLPDDWEMYFLLDPTDNGSVYQYNGPNGDPDSDGRSNYSEFMSGTNPRQAQTTPQTYPGYPYGGIYGGGYPFGGFYGGGYPFGGIIGGIYGGMIGGLYGGGFTGGLYGGGFTGGLYGGGFTGGLYGGGFTGGFFGGGFTGGLYGGGFTGGLYGGGFTGGFFGGGFTGGLYGGGFTGGFFGGGFYGNSFPYRF